jgi:ribosomal protein S8
MIIKNIGNKIIGIGNVNVLPNESAEVPKEFEKSVILEIYKKCGIVEISGEASTPDKTDEEIALAKAEAEQKAIEDAEKLRKKRLASLKNISEEDLAKLANELGISPADCKDQADVLAKVKEALSK